MNRDTGRFAVILSLMALAALFGRQPAKAQSPTYSFINLGTLDTGASSQAYGINIFDEVVGVSTIAPANSSGVVISHAFFWSPGNGMLDLFPADTTLNSEAHGINLFGQFAGFHQIADGSTHAFIGDIFNGIETDPYTNNNWAYSINDEAQAAGQTLYSDGTEEESWYELFDGGIFGLGNGGNQNATAYGIADLTPTESFGDTAGVMYPGGGFDMTPLI